MLKDRKILGELYNSFKPEPLPAGHEVYMDCEAVRGGKNILNELGEHILWSDKPTCSLYTGHRGCGKSTELLRLKSHLENEGMKVVYFAADEADIDPEDARYTDILLACTRHLLQELKGKQSKSSKATKEKALKEWLKNVWEDIKQLATTEVDLESVEIEIPFVKLNANLRGNPTMRSRIREQLEPHTVNLLDALNEFISEADKQFNKKIVLIVDNLDRIVPIYKEKLSKTNHEEIFIDRCEQLKGLACHVIYTVPISLLYSAHATHLEDRYGMIALLPVIKVMIKDGRQPYQQGVETLLELINKRMAAKGSNLNQVFCDPVTVQKLCLISGGHLRNLVQLLQTALRNLPQAKSAEEAINKAIASMRETYISSVNDDDWPRLAQVYLQQEMPNQPAYRNLLFGRCILEYCDDQLGNGNSKWQDVHPLILDIEQFKRAVNQLNAAQNPQSS